MRTVAVTGGREYDDTYNLQRVLTEMHNADPIGLLVHGACSTGADALADEWARAWNIPVKPYPADWRRYGAAAGPIRNQNMLWAAKPAVLVAFPGGRGTADCVARAQSLGIPIVFRSSSGGEK